MQHQVLIVMFSMAYSYGSRVQLSTTSSQISHSEALVKTVLGLKSRQRACGQDSGNPSASFAAFLLALNPTAAFVSADVLAHSHATALHPLRSSFVADRTVANAKPRVRVLMSDRTESDFDICRSDPSHLFEEGSGCEQPSEICEKAIPHMADFCENEKSEMKSKLAIPHMADFRENEKSEMKSKLANTAEEFMRRAVRDIQTTVEVESYCSDPSHLFEEASACDLTMVQCDLNEQPSELCEELIPHMVEMRENERNDAEEFMFRAAKRFWL